MTDVRVKERPSKYEQERASLKCALYVLNSYAESHTRWTVTTNHTHATWLARRNHCPCSSLLAQEVKVIVVRAIVFRNAKFLEVEPLLPNSCIAYFRGICTLPNEVYKALVVDM